MTNAKPITEKDLAPPQDKLPTKQERKAQKELEERTFAQIKDVKAKCMKFFNEEILTLETPFYVVEQALGVAFASLLKVHKHRSDLYKKIENLKEDLNEIPMVKLAYVEKDKK